jgi:hypothetical protein
MAGVLGLCVTAVAGASPFFEGTTADVWVIDAETGRIAGYDFGRWVEEFAPSGQPLVNLRATEQGLVNALAGSSVALTPGQPAISVADVGQVAPSGGANAPRPSLQVSPADGAYSATIAVRIGVSTTLLDEGNLQLSWRINGGELQEEPVSRGLLTAQNSTGGYYQRTVYLVRDDEYELDVILSTPGGTELARELRRYRLSSDHPDGFRRDTDGDGIPDLVEIELGLDPFSDDWQADLDGDGWSRFDKWLRARCLDAELVPIEDGDGCLDEDGLPIDSDGDGWADFDERLRRTRHDDLEPVLAPLEGESPEHESFRRRVLRYKDFPAARRLYEVERIIEGRLLPASPGSWSDLVGATVLGETAYQLRDLLTPREVDASGLRVEELAPRRLLEVAETRLQGDQLPALRLPAGDSAVLAAVQALEAEPAGASRVYKAWLARQPDATPRQFYLARGTSRWDTAAEWRAAYIRFLAESLALPAELELSLGGTEAVSILEGALGEEARLSGLAPLQAFAYPRSPVSADLVLRSEEALARFATEGADLDGAVAQIRADIGAGGPMQALAAWLRPSLTAPPPATRSDLHVVGQFQRSFDASCFLDDESYADLQEDPVAWAVFTSRCERRLTLAELEGLYREDAGRRYLARLFLLPGAAARVADDPSLADGFVDSDADGLENAVELDAVLARIALPWLADTDGDGLADGSDPCPADPLDLCSATPRQPRVTLDPDFTVFEPGSGSRYALIGIELDRAHDAPVTISYETFLAAGDTATPGADFVPVSGSVTLAPGQRVVIVRVAVLGDALEETPESFSFRLLAAAGATLSGPVTVRVTINDTPSDGGCDAAGCRVGLEVQGLVPGNLLVLQNNGSDDLALTEDGRYFFPRALPDGSAFAVTIAAQPKGPAQDCVVLNGEGVLDGADFPDVLVLCFAAVSLQATAGDAQVTLDWNAANFPGATFGLCRAEEELAGSFDNCLAYTDGQLFENVSRPLVQSSLVNGRRYWYQLEVRHAQGVRTVSATTSAMPEAPPEPGRSRLNDTGQRLCYGSAWSECNESSTGDQAIRPRQDGRFGRDAMATAGALAKAGGGSAGFDFTPLDAAGQPIAIVDGAPAATPACVRDNVSGLTWEVKTPENASRNFTRGGAFTYASTVNADAGLCGFTDWRVPDRRELFSIVDNSSRFAAFDERYFPNTMPTSTVAASLYWTNDTYNANPGYAWTITFATGVSSEQLASSLQKVRLVRGDRLPQGDFRDNGDGTVTDLTNGLVWDKCSWGQSWDAGANTCSAQGDALNSHWDGALTAAVTANKASHRGQRDWRLPNRVELESLLRLNANLPAIDTEMFPSTVPVGYWASTPYAISLDAWRVAFDYGRVSNNQMSLGNRIRLVRGGDAFDLLAPIQSRLNDTGRIQCFDGAGLGNCTAVVAGDAGLFPQQDGRFGRDARDSAGELSKSGGGSAGFDFTPLGSDGQVIALVGGAPASPPACVRDNVTGLTWEVKTAANAGATYTWNAADAYAGDLNSGGGLCGHSDWRIPTRRELLSIVDHERSQPAIDRRFFPNTSTSTASIHWAADTDLSGPAGARRWTVNFAYGDSISGVEADAAHAIRLVRGEALPQARFRDNGDGTVTDMSTGLTWDKCAWGQSRDAATNRCGSPSEMTQLSWGEALQVPVTANSRLHRGHSGWRLPNRTELESLFDLARTFPAMDAGGTQDGAFGNAPAGGSFWTSTIRTADFTGPTVWFGNFDFGDSAGASVSRFPPPLYGVRLVRGGEAFDLLK